MIHKPLRETVNANQKYTVYIMSKNATKTNTVVTMTDLMKVINATQTATETFDKVLKSNESTKYVGVSHFTIVGFDKSTATCYCNTTVANALVNAKLIDDKSITRDRKCSDNTDYKVDKNSGVKYEVRPHMFKVTTDLKTLTALIKTALTALATATK